MKHAYLLAAALLAGAATTAIAQPTDVPPMKCEKPRMPGERMMEDRTIRNRFERDMKAYGDCVKAYVAERQATAVAHQQAIKAHTDAANTAVGDYNALLKSMNEAAAAK
jgi:hypothetical protein